MSSAAAPRPQSAAEIMDASVQLVRRNYWPFLALAALFNVPFAVVKQLSFPAMMAASLTTLQTGRATELPQLPLFAWTFGSFFWAIGTTAVVLTLAAADAHGGQDIVLGKEITRMIRRSPAAIALALQGIVLFTVAIVVSMVPVVIIVAMGMMFLPSGVAGTVGVVVGILFSVALMGYMAAALLPSLPILVLERLGPAASLRRSAQLTKGLRGHVFAVYALTYLLLAVVMIAMFVVFRVIGQPSLASTAGIVVGTVITPFVRVPGTLLYYDLRVRKEGYDMEVMAGALESEAAPQIA